MFPKLAEGVTFSVCLKRNPAPSPLDLNAGTKAAMIG